jgi:hypothetical protein
MQALRIASEVDNRIGALEDASLLQHEDSRYVESPQGNEN